MMFFGGDRDYVELNVSRLRLGDFEQLTGN
jgi:hypothetical protein